MYVYGIIKHYYLNEFRILHVYKIYFLEKKPVVGAAYKFSRPYNIG